MIEIINDLGAVEKIISKKGLTAGINILELSAKECNMSEGFHFIKIIAGNKISVVKLGFF